MAEFYVPVSIQQSSTASTWLEIQASGNNNLAGTHVAAFHVVPTAASGFAKTVTVRMRRQSGVNPPRVYVGLYDVDVTGKPNNRLAYSSQYIEVTSTANEGALYTFQLDGGLSGGLPPALISGTKFAIVVHCSSGTVRVARVAAPSTGGFWSKKQISAPMASPFGTATTTASAAPFAAWVTFDQSVAPTATLVSPLSSATVMPTFVGTFSDANAGDRITAYRIEIRKQNSSDLIPGSSQIIPATPADASANSFTLAWSGTPLEENKAHEWRAQVADRTNIWSAWTPWQAISVAASGVIIMSNASPYGKLESWPPSNFTAQWQHISNYAMTHIEIRVMRDNAVLVTSNQVAVGSIASGSTVQVATASLGLGTIGAGSYTWQARGKAAVQNEWGAWSESRSFSVNAPPNQAYVLYPTNDIPISIGPTLRWRITDPDEDDITGIEVAAQVEVTRPDGTVVYVPTLNNVDPANFIYTTSDAANGEMYYDTTNATVPTGVLGRYRWRVRGRDISAGVYGAWSNEASFLFSPAPNIALNQPANNSTVATSTPLVQWDVTLDNAVAYQISVYRQATTTNPIYTSGRVNYIGNQRSVNIPGGYLTPSRTYDLYVTVWGQGGLSTTTPKTTFTVTYPDADALGGVEVSLVAKRRDYEPSTPVVSWLNGNVNNFVGYAIRRRTATNQTSVPVAFITGQQTQSWYDHAAPPNSELTYEVSRLVRVGSDVRESPRELKSIEVPLTVPTLTSVNDGANIHAAVMWLSSGLSGAFERPEATYVTWGGGGAPTVITTPESYGKHSVSLSITVRQDSRGTLDDHYGDFLDIVQSGHPLIYRGEDTRLFCRVVSFSWQRGGTPGTKTISLELEEIAWDETVSIPT